MIAMGVATKLREMHDLPSAATGGVVVAFSGGTDSTLVAAVASRALGERAWR